MLSSWDSRETTVIIHFNVHLRARFQDIQAHLLESSSSLLNALCKMNSKNVQKECMFFKRFGVKRSSVLSLTKSGIKVFVADGDSETRHDAG